MDGQQTQGGLTDEQLFAQQQGQSPQAPSPSLGKTDEELFLSPDAQIAKKEHAATNISHAFGEGFNEATDHYQDLGLSQETQDWVRSSGLYKNIGMMGQAIFDQVIMPASAALDAGMHTAAGAFITAPLAAAGQAGEEAGLKGARGGAGEISDYLLQSPVLAEFGHGPEMPKFTPTDLLKAKVAGVLDGDGAYFGTKELTPEQVKAQEGAAAALPPEPEKVVPPDLHTAARNVAPEVFDQYDRLQANQTVLRGQLNDMQTQKTADLDAQIKEIQDAKQGGYGKLQSLIEKRDALAAQDTPEQAALRDQMQKNYYAMRDLSPQVSQAYRAAEANLPPPPVEEVETPEEAKARRSEGVTHGEYEIDNWMGREGDNDKTPVNLTIRKDGTGFVEVAGHILDVSSAIKRGLSPEEIIAENLGDHAQGEKPDASKVRKTEQENAPVDIDQHRQTIISDMKDKLIAAGRPEEEAEAAANLVAEHYGARSERFNGALGTAQEMYDRDAAEIKAGRGKVKARELAQENPGIIDRIKQIFSSPKDDGTDLYQKARGKIRLATDDAKATITLMKNANASTFIHETGHHWLEELMGDAEHEAAPGDLVSDASTVRKWLGNEGEELTTRQHEKFARGFERYMMEGVAPSKNLASVFDKFRQWLNQIYVSVQKLRAPINDDIRDVFARLLANKPEKTVLGPEAEPGKAMANIHEVDAEQTPPEKAEATADNIRDEMKATAKQHDNKEAENVIEQAEKTGGSQGNINGSGESSGTAGPEPGPANPEPSTLGGGRGEAAAEGAGLQSAASEGSGASAGSDGSAERGNKPVTDPNSPVKSKPDLIDKAGNIRLENLTSNEDVREVMRQSARDNNEYWDARRGVVTDQMVSDLASAMGIADKEINLQKLRQVSLEDGVPLAVRIKVGRQMLVQSANAARDAMIKAAASGSEEDLINLAEARRRHLMIAETVSSITAEWGRAGRAFRDISQEEGEKAENITDLFQRMTGKTPQQMLEMAKKGGALDTPAQVAKFIQDSKKPSFGDMLLEYWINGLISGPATHVTYTVGNTLLALWKSVPETAVASLLGKLHGEGVPETAVNGAMENIRGILHNPAVEDKLTAIQNSLTHPSITDDIKSKVMDAAKNAVNIPKADMPAALAKIEDAFGKTTSGIRMGEVAARPKAAVQALPTALSAAGKALKTGVTTLLPGEAEATTPFQFGRMGVEPGKIANTDVTWKQLGADAFGTMKGMRDAFVGIGNLIKNGGVDQEPAFKVKPTPLGDIPNVAVKGIEIPTGDIIRAPGRVIAAIHSFFRTMNYSMEKSALAYRTAADEGLKDDAFTNRVAEIGTNPTVDQMQAARSEATEATLMGQGGKFTQMISRLTNTAVNLPGLGETRILKFIDPFVHISSNIIEQSILERTPIGLLSSEIRADLSGVNGATVRDVAQSKMLVGTALGITIGGLAAEGFVSGSGPSDPHESMMWRLAGNQPHSVRIGDTWYDTHRLGPLGMMVSVAADMYDVAHVASQGEMSKVASMLVHAVTQNILDESFMRGPADLIKALTDSDRYGDQYIRNMAASFVPFSVGMSQIAHSVDPYTRQTRSVMDAIKAKIPFESESLLPRRDIWGQPMPNKSVFGVPGFSSIYETPVGKDPVNLAMMKLGIYPALPQRDIRGVKLTDQQYDDYTRIGGQLAKARLDEMVSASGFSEMPEYNQTELIKKTIEASRETARNMVLMQNPSLIQEARAKKLKAMGKTSQ